MTEEALTAALAERVMGWKATPDRFIKSGRSWLPKWRFAPLTRLDDAFLLLDRAASHYRLVTVEGGTFTAEVQVGARTGKASGEPKARAITIAVARALGVEVPR
jgi:hypothetical protein